jgi:hypothetical protein
MPCAAFYFYFKFFASKHTICDHSRQMMRHHFVTLLVASAPSFCAIVVSCQRLFVSIATMTFVRLAKLAMLYSAVCLQNDSSKFPS